MGVAIFLLGCGLSGGIVGALIAAADLRPRNTIFVIVAIALANGLIVYGARL